MEHRKLPMAGLKPPLISVRGLAASDERFRRGYSDALAGRSLGINWQGWEYRGGHAAGRLARKEMVRILDSLKAKLGKEPEFARITAVDDLTMIGLTHAEAWNLVWEATPVEAVDNMEAAE